MKSYERALEELQFPQMAYHVQGGYGEPVSATAILGTVGSIAGSIFGMSTQQKQQEAALQAQTQIAREQALIQGQVASQQAANAAQHAANMPMYLLIGAGSVAFIGVIVTRRRK